LSHNLFNQLSRLNFIHAGRRNLSYLLGRHLQLRQLGNRLLALSKELTLGQRAAGFKSSNRNIARAHKRRAQRRHNFL